MNLVHKFVYAFLRALIRPFFFLKGYRYKQYKPKNSSYLVLSNHNTNWDFFLCGLLLRPHMYFVASEHIYRLGFVSKIIKFLGGPIPRKKGASGDEAGKNILQALREGKNVCIFAEGNRSFSGETGFIPPRTAALAKESGVGLITMALHGGYFINPRWGGSTRRGRNWGEVVNEYTPEELASMTQEEVYDHICRDLYVNAYADQEKTHVKYKGKAIAENLENTLFYCPSCGSFSSLHSHGNKLECSVCGKVLKYNEYGNFEDPEGKEPVYKTVLSWFDAELDILKNALNRKKEDPSSLIFSDSSMRLKRLDEDNVSGPVSGKLQLYSDRLEFDSSEKKFSFPVKTISKISLLTKGTLLFTCPKGYYEIKCDGQYCGIKYIIATMFLSGKEYKTGRRY